MIASMHPFARLRGPLGALLLAVLVSGCAAERVFNQGQALIDEGRLEEGVARLDEAARLAPSQREYRQVAQRQREMSVARLLNAGDEARARGASVEAERLYRRALILEPKSDRARQGLEEIVRADRAREMVTRGEALLAKGDLEGAYELAREATALASSVGEARALVRRIEQQSAGSSNPKLGPAFRKPVTLEFRGAPLRMVFDLIAQNTGLNFVFDREVRQDQPTTIVVRNTSVDEVIQFVMVSNQLQRRVLNDRSVLIYPATQAKQREYQELVVRTFYLGNADPKQALNLLRTVVKSRDVFVDEKVNMIVMRDTPEAIRIAEKLLANQDLAEPEVMLELEVLEVSRNQLYELGMRYPDQLSLSVIGTTGQAGSLTLPEWLGRSAGNVRYSTNNPAFVLNLRNSIGNSNLLANPRIRVRNREKAKVHIGDKVPVITTTSTATGFISEAVQYLDVGLKLDVEPVVHIEEEVGIRISLEVSSIVGEIRSPSGTLTYRIGTRNAATVLRLKDGETQILAGLISDEERSSANRIPGLGAIPMMGRLFGSQLDQSTKTEVMLLVTPRIVRHLARPDLRRLEFLSGTEASMGGAGLAGAGSAGTAPATFSPGPIPGVVPPGVQQGGMPGGMPGAMPGGMPGSPPQMVIPPPAGTFGPTFITPGAPPAQPMMPAQPARP